MFMVEGLILPLCSITAMLSGLFVNSNSRLRAGALRVGPDGDYDLGSVAATVLGGTALAAGRGGVLGTFASDYLQPNMPPQHYALCGCQDMPGFPERWGGEAPPVDD